MKSNKRLSTKAYMSSNLLQIFAKEPVPGTVKTRLAIDIGEVEACLVYERLLKNTIRHGRSKKWRSELWCSPAKSQQVIKKLVDEYAIGLIQQHGSDLGRRMLFSLCSGLDRCDNVVLIGSDCPVLTDAYIEAAFSALKAFDVVFGPAEDGGYVLIGCRKTQAEMFSRVTWSSKQTLHQNIAAVQRCGLTHALLPTVWDVDTLKDLQRWRALKGTLAS